MPPTGVLLFGYRMDAKGRWLIDSVEGPVVIEVYSRFLSGQGIMEITEWLRGSGVRSGYRFQRRGMEPTIGRRGAGVWWPSRVKMILTNPAYLGKRRWRGQAFPIPALIDEATFRRVQASVLAKAKDHRKALQDPDRGFLSGLLRCGFCGHKVYFATLTKPNKKVYYRYICHKRRYERPRGYVPTDKPCPFTLIDKDVLEGAVLRFFGDLLTDPAQTIRRVNGLTRLANTEVTALIAGRDRIRNALLELQRSAEAIQDEAKARKWPPSWVQKRLDDLLPYQRQAEAELQEVERQLTSRVHGRDVGAAVQAGVAELRALLTAATTTVDKRRLMTRLIAAGRLSVTGHGSLQRIELTLTLRWSELVGRPPSAVAASVENKVSADAQPATANARLPAPPSSPGIASNLAQTVLTADLPEHIKAAVLALLVASGAKPT